MILIVAFVEMDFLNQFAVPYDKTANVTKFIFKTNYSPTMWSIALNIVGVPNVMY